MRRFAAPVLLTMLFMAGDAAVGEAFYWQRAIHLERAGTYKTGIFDESASEIPAYDRHTKRLFVVNSAQDSLDVFDLHDPANIQRIKQVPTGGNPNSVAVHRGLVAVAVEAAVKTDPGSVKFYDTDGTLLKTLTVGALPDMVTFTPDGDHVLVANEGEPNDDYTVDPEGSVSVIDLSRGLNRAIVRTADFHAFNAKKAKLQAAGVRIFGPDLSTADPKDTVSVSQDFEPEYIAVSDDSRRAWVSLQENNAFAVIDIRRAKVIDVLPLGYKDHSKTRNALDASDKDDGINIKPWPVYGMYQPDTIATYRVRGRTYIVSANEGDSRDYDGYSEEARVKDLDLDPVAFPDAATLQKNANLGRLNVTTANGDADGDGKFEKLFAFGARSFAIWTDSGHLVFDSGDDFEQITAAQIPADFNSDNSENGSFDGRSDNKGPEPEGVAIGEIGGRTYAFVGFERIGGIIVYDITNPYRPRYVEYVNNRDFGGDPEADTAGDLGPEGLLFIAAKDSPTRKPLLVVANEVSGSTSIYRIESIKDHDHQAWR